jgi:hypothetical protein
VTRGGAFCPPRGPLTDRDLAIAAAEPGAAFVRSAAMLRSPYGWWNYHDAYGKTV